MRTTLFCGALLGAILSGIGCGDGGGSGGGVEAGIVAFTVENEPDNFVLSGGVALLTTSKTYVWSCGDDQANISIEDGLSFGSIRFEVEDAVGSIVHDNTYHAVLGGTVSAVTRPGGVPGDWTVRLTFSNATWGGDLALSADTGNAADVIHLEGGYVTTSTFVYDVGWPAGTAQIQLADGLAVGSVRIRVWDPTGTLKYDQFFVGPMGADILDATASGVAGTWSVRIDLTSTVNGGTIILSSS